MKFYGLFGETLGHSISPQIHKKIYEIAGIEGAYKNFEIAADELEEALTGLKVLGISGSNVTIPYKQAFIPLMDSLSPLAERLHSVNTIKNNNGYFEGYNTDYDGIALTFELRNWQVKDKHTYILGSGGASLAIAHYFQDQGAASVTIVSRSAGEMDGPWEYIDYEELTGRTGDIIVNCTPVGMYPNVDASPVDESVIANFEILFDMTYNPVETVFLQIGNRLGKQTTNGLDMLVGQAIRSVAIWEDREFTKEEVLEILNYFRENWTGAL
ncbi:shikimate dehydrogenase [Jeotgalibaca sp. A122]|uniref:shikimate dehydrogenase n=1 Tax=Jeotgalibaca sp. A122 TaxID=3457322 RepID=UPI003FD44E2E